MRPAGYTALIERHALTCVPPWHRSFLGETNTSRRLDMRPEGVVETYPRSWEPEDTTLDHLLFALKHDGLELGVIVQVLPHLDPRRLVDALVATPLSAPLRRLWFLYEWLTCQRLDRPDLTSGNYIPLLDPSRHYTTDRYRSPRQRVVMNALGTVNFCPQVRRTPTLDAFAAKRLDERAAGVGRGVDADLLSRATAYLYTKESRTSFEIERESPTQQRLGRFLRVLERPPPKALTKEHLIEVHKAIVDSEFAEPDYRSDQVYIGESIGPGGQRIHYIAPKPAEVPAMMAALLAGVRHSEGTAQGFVEDLRRINGGLGQGTILRTGSDALDPVVQAAVVGFGFVYIHPFADGNGRLHRYLIHHVLARRQVTPPGQIIPVSAAILRDRSGYDRVLETQSRPIMSALDFSESADGTVEVLNDSASLYRYPDLTAHAEYLYAKVEEAIDKDMHDEIRYLQTYDRARDHLRAVKHLPDIVEHRFLQFCLQNHGRISAGKRARYFPMLDDTAIGLMEAAVRMAMQEATDDGGAADPRPEDENR